MDFSTVVVVNVTYLVS